MEFGRRDQVQDSVVILRDADRLNLVDVFDYLE